LEALTQLADLGLSPDAMLVDYELDEGVRGPEVIARIIARHGVIPARIITGHLVAEMHAHCRAAGLEVLPKPIDPAELEAFLKAAVG
jgi:CheY-like chemotaxis protein